MARTEEADPSFRRAVGVAAVLLVTTYLIFSGVFSHLAPMGDWKNEIFGHPVWSEWDPGGPYVDAAHQLTWGQGQLFEGHPGLGLMLPLSGLQHAYYALAGSDSGYTFTEYTARNLPAVFVLSKLLMTTLHLVACFVTFLLARRVLRDDRAAVFAAFGYATSLNVAYYLSRISVEPVVVICFVLSVLAIWRYQDRAREERLAPALWFVALSAILAVTGAVTKLNFLAPLPPFLALYLLLGGWREGDGSLIAGRTRSLALLVFAGTTSGVGLFYSQLIDWPSFFSLWKHFTGLPPPAWEIVKLLPSFTPDGIFPLCELVYIILGATGWMAFLRTNPDHRMPALWVSAFGVWGLLLFGYRMSSIGTFRGFHYFHVTNVVVSIFFGYAMVLALRRLRMPEVGWRAVALGLLAIGVIHATTIWTVIDTRRRDAVLYAPNREIHHVIAELGPEQRLACIDCGQAQKKIPNIWFPEFYSLSSVGWLTPVRSQARSLLAGEFESLFVPVKRSDFGPHTKRIRVAALDSTIIVVNRPSER